MAKGKKVGGQAKKRPRTMSAEDDALDSGDDVDIFVQSQQLAAELAAAPSLRQSKKLRLKLQEMPNNNGKRSNNTNDDDDDDNDHSGNDDDDEKDAEEEAEYKAYVQLMQEKGLFEKSDANSANTKKVYSNNTVGMKTRLNEIALNKPNKVLPFVETLAITSQTPLELDSSQVHDDIKRELAFYKQALYAAEQAKIECLKANIPFTRPDDYFAEMLKSDEHMHKVRTKLVNEQEGIVASENAKKQREMKKFGKKVQNEKIIERAHAKKQEIEKVTLARKKKQSLGASGETAGDDEFGVEVETTSDHHSNKRKGMDGGRSAAAAGGPNTKRQKKDEKYGFGGKKKTCKRKYKRFCK